MCIFWNMGDGSQFMSVVSSLANTWFDDLAVNFFFKRYFTAIQTCSAHLFQLFLQDWQHWVWYFSLWHSWKCWTRPQYLVLSAHTDDNTELGWIISAKKATTDHRNSASTVAWKNHEKTLPDRLMKYPLTSDGVHQRYGARGSFVCQE